MIRSREIGVERGVQHEALRSAPRTRSAPSGSSRSDVAFSLPPPQPGRDVEQLRARDAEQEDRRVAREVGDVLDEVDEDGLGPLQVVDDDDLRPLHSPGFEQPPERELRLGRRRADDGVRLDADRDQDLDERPVGDPLAVREAAAAEDVGRVADALEEVRDEARLADPGRAEQREEPARAGRRRRPRSRARAAGARASVRRAASRGGARWPADSASTSRSRNASTGSDLPFEDERLDRLDSDGVADEAARLGSDERPRRAPAACSSRAATLTASPVTSVSPSPPTTTSPVLIPMRASSPCSAMAARISEPQREPRAARRLRARRGSRRRPSPRRRRTSRRCRRGARGSREDPRSSGASVRAAPRDRSTRRAQSSRRGRRRGR